MIRDMHIEKAVIKYDSRQLLAACDENKGGFAIPNLIRHIEETDMTNCFGKSRK